MDILITRNLTLRRPIAEDADDIAYWLSDWDVTRNLARVPWPYRVEDAESWIALARDPKQQIYTVHSSCLIGVVSLEDDAFEPTLGFWLAKPWHRRGLMLEALNLILGLAFANPELRKIRSSALIDNEASLKLQARVGFKLRGTREIHSVPRQERVMLQDTVLERQDWAAFRAGSALGQLAASKAAQSVHFAA